jgi:hypothetical protein
MFSMTRSRVSIVTAGVLWMSFCSALMAEPVSPDRALEAAGGFLKARALVPPKEPRTLSATAKGRTADVVRAVRADDGTVLAYVTTMEPRGFVVTSADTDVSPIIAYSFDGSADAVSDRSNPLYLLLTQDMKLRVQAAEQGEADVAENHIAWSVYSSNQAAAQSVQQWPPENSTTTGGWEIGRAHV